MQAFTANSGALSIEQSYEMFDLAILVALECNFRDPRNPESNCLAHGDLFEEDTGNLVPLEASMNETRGTFTIGTVGQGCTKGLVDTMVIYGSIKPSKIVIIEEAHSNFTYDQDTKRLVINKMGLNFCAQNSQSFLSVSWYT